MAKYRSGCPAKVQTDVEMREFSAVVYRQGRGLYVDVPDAVSLAFGIHGELRVIGSLDGHPIQTTLTPVGEGRHRIHLRSDLCRQAAVRAKGQVTLILKRNANGRKTP